MFRSLLALCVLFPIQLVTADWYAVFWNSTLKSQLNTTFLTQTRLTANDNSSLLFQCDHTTIAFQPNDTTPYIPRLGEKQTARILGYAHDENGQAILLRYDSANPIPTTNAFPHTTISVSNQGPYGAVYSNDLWARVNASGAVNMTFSNGFPDTVAFADTTNVVNNTLTLSLPAINLTKSYAATTVQVILPPVGGWFELEGIFCVNGYGNVGWNGSVCIPPTTATTATPTTVAPTTAAPNTTVAPTTVAPTTVAPTTSAPTTVAPTTPVPTTKAPINNTASAVNMGYGVVMLSSVLLFLH